ncbi:MAG: DUF2075 domain-containing protein [Sphaerochaeta sp.]
MREERFYFQSTIKEFLRSDSDTILGAIVHRDSFTSLQLMQREAWVEEIAILKHCLKDIPEGHILFEYSIPRLGKRIDVVLLLDGIVFVLEFKCGESQFLRKDTDQVWDYALDLKNFHEASHDRIIVPLLVATEAEDSAVSTTVSFCRYDDDVYEPICTNSANLLSCIVRILKEHPDCKSLAGPYWLYSRYSPTPTIIEAASYLFNNHSVEDITRSDATGEQLNETTDAILDIVAEVKSKKEKAICFVTGVPGSGKTLVGLKVAISQFEKNERNKSDLAVYLSGNGPLVKVLTEALARDKKKHDDVREPDVRHFITSARRQVNSFIQIVHHYRNNSLAKIKLLNGRVEVDDTKTVQDKDDGYSEVDHVAIFDEAQRAWTKEQLANWLSRRQGLKNFPQSEPEFLIWSMDLRPDWAVIICLVGGGQEINTGEAGISEWIKAINASFPNWKMYISPNLTEKEYAEGTIHSLVHDKANVVWDSRLHLSVSMRSFRTERLSLFVHNLLECELDPSRALYAQLCKKYPIVLTRSVEKAKQWLRQQARGSERYGMLVSSQAYRLRPLAIDVRAKPDTVHWFLDDENDIRSSLFMEDVATEFEVQGLELDWACIVWDGDFRYSKTGWKHFSFTGATWQNINSEQRKKYQLNAYRVLLTRARQGMVIVVPEGSDEDPTRVPSFYTPTYNYLKQIGLALLS